MILKINNSTNFIQPLKMEITKSDLYSDFSERSAETGTLLQYPIRFGIYSLDLEFLGNSAEISQIESLISGTDIAVDFMDGDTEITGKKFYPSDRLKTATGAVNSRKYRLSFTLIEV